MVVKEDVEGGGQVWDAGGYVRHAGFVAELGTPVLDLLDPKPGECILDLGCGDGRLSEELAKRGALVRGADTSRALLDVARRRGLSVTLIDGQELDYERAFDAVFSNAALHWMKDAEAVVKGVAGALKPGGRFVGEFGGFGNVAAIVTALLASLDKHGIDAEGRNPWFFPSDGAYKQLLESHGFEVKTIGLHPRPTPLPTGMEGWLETFANPFLRGIDVAVAANILSHTAKLLRPSLCDERGQWIADYVRLRFSATLRE